MAITDYRPTGQFWIAAGGALVVLLVIIFIVKPAFTGYAVYRAMQQSGVPDTYTTNIEQLREDMEHAEVQAQDALAAQARAVQDAKDAAQAKMKAATELTSCVKQGEAASQENLEKLKSQDALIKSLDDERHAAKELVQQCQDDIDAAEEAKAVIADAARRICCMQRVENKEIDSYRLDNGKIVCASGADDNLEC